MEYDKKLLENLAQEIIAFLGESKNRIEMIEILSKELDNSRK